MRTSLLVAAVAVAAVLAPSTASAAAWQGVVVAKDTGRSSFATASRGGLVRSVRSSAARGLRIGDRVAVRAARRADGTHVASRVGRTGRVSAAVVRGTVVAHQRRLNRTLVSAGGSILAVRRAPTVPAGAGTDTGDIVSAAVRIGANGLSARRVRELGQAQVLELRGIFLDVEEAVLRLAVVKRGLVTVRVPAEASVPQLDSGDLIVLVASVDEEGKLVLVSVKRDGNGDGDKGVEVGEDEVTVRGAVATLEDTSVGVRPGSAASPVTCLVPAGTPLVAFFVGDEVELRCHFVAGAFRLEHLSGKSAWLKVRDGKVYADFGLYGVLAELGEESVRATVHGRPVACARPAGADLAAFAVGSEVKLGCSLAEGAFRLTFLKSAAASWFAGEKGEAPTGEMTIEGTLETIDASSASVRSAAGLFTCSHANAGLPAIFPAGQPATMRCRLGSTGWRLVKLHSGSAWVILEP